MENLAPPVVAVIVTCDPGPWFEDTLRSLAAQDYPELAVLVLDAVSPSDPTAVVAEILPAAFVRRLEHDGGYAANVNEVLGMVQGASHLLLLHDDVTLDPDAVHVMVEESLRSNAGIVTPKVVSWDDPTQLLHVGMAVDKGGAVVDRVEPLEIDHGQHDAVQDVFLAPGGCTLVRADLFAELGGMSPVIVAMGEDLDLCWRAQVAGARVVVAPGARVRHLQRLAGGMGTLPAAAAVDASIPANTHSGRPAPLHAQRRGPRVTLQALQRRHELRTVLTVYSPFHLMRILPQLVALSAAEFVIGVATGTRPRARAVAHAWRWNWAHRSELRAARTAVRDHRRLPDSEVRRLQVRGSARLTAFVRRAVTHGLSVAQAGAAAEAQALIDAAEDPEPERQRRQLGRTGRAVVWAAVILVVVVGTRQLVGGGFPYMGQLLPLPSWSELLHRFASGWQPTGLGTTDPVSPATAPLGVASLVLFGSAGFVQKVIVLGSIPLGAVGVSRLLRPFGSAWARMGGTIAYLALPLVYDSLAMGRFDGVLAYGAAPWILLRLARASAVSPYTAVGSGVGGWRASLWGQALVLGLLVGAWASLAPQLVVVTLLIGVLLALSMVLMRSAPAAHPGRRVLWVTVGSVAVAVALLAPWSVALLSGPARWAAITGVPVTAAQGLSWTSLIRFDVGPIGGTPLAFGLLATAGLPLVIGSRRRLQWAVHAWVLVLGAFALAWTEGRGWLGGFGVDPQTLLAPAAVGVAVAVGLGAAAFERDLPGYRFGWRQVATMLAAAGAVVGVLPVLAAAGSGRWDQPLSGYGQATAFLAQRAPVGGFRVLWLADPRVLPGNGWEFEPGLAYALSDGGLPDATSWWPGGQPGPAASVAGAVESAASGDTARLGAILAADAVRYVVVVESLAPDIPGYQTPYSVRPPDRLVDALEAQQGLRQVVGQGGFQAFVVDAALPEFSLRLGAAPPPLPTPVVGRSTDLSRLFGWMALPAPSPSGTAVATQVAPGTVLVARAPAPQWQAVEEGPGGATLSPSTAFGYGAAFTVNRGGPIVIRYRGSWLHALEVAAEMAVWIVLLFVVLVRRRPATRSRATARHLARHSGGAHHG